MIYRFLVFSLILIFSGQFSIAQSTKKKDVEFRIPVDIPIYLSGTFGELRKNHFHSGLDIKTQGRQGFPVHASEEGYVSRIKVSPDGYGKALYITHPNGYVTVYGHLQRFNDTLQQFVVKKQYEKESFDIQLFPKKNELRVKKGEVVAFSGNTGGSSGAHLHYEVREERSQHPVNPLLFRGIEIKDQYKPKILELVVYPVDKNSMINGRNDTAFFMVAGSGTNHYLPHKPELHLQGNISFGLRSYDPMNDIGNKNGVYSLTLDIDSVEVFRLEMDKLSFATTRYMNSLIDYGYYKRMRRRVIRTQIDTNNRLFNYRDVKSNGIYSFVDGKSHTLTFRVADVYDNTALLSLTVLSDTLSAVSTDPPAGPDTLGTWFDFREKNTIRAPHINLTFPPNAFYRSFSFHFDSVSGNETTFSPIYKIHDRLTPVQKYFTLSVKPAFYPPGLKEKLYIAYLNEEGNWYIGGSWKNGFLETDSRVLGNYSVMADTTAPLIKPVNLKEGKKFQHSKKLKVVVLDNETGVDKYRGTLNGLWILMEYDRKTNTLTYQPDDRIKKGKNNFRLEVTDKVGNKTVYEASFMY